MKHAVIESGQNVADKQICGLYPLERNIRLLWKSGFTEITLRLSGEEETFYHQKIAKSVKKLKGLSCKIEQKKTRAKKMNQPDLLIQSSHFLQIHYFGDIKKYFRKKAGILQPVENEDLFLLENDEDYMRAQGLVIGYIKDNTGGYLARNLNKRISIPISLKLAPLGIHPNYLTAVNMVVGFLSAVFLFFDNYPMTVLGGLFFQMASVFDGVDGEVAKFTFKFSEFGSWLDTFSDNMTLLLFLGASSWLFFHHTGGLQAVVIIVCLFAGVATMFGAMIFYLRRYSDSGSFVMYDKKFLQKLPADDFLVRFVLAFKYITKKEFFALFFFLVSLTGRIYYIIPMIAIVVVAGGFLLLIINKKYRYLMGK